MSVHRGQPASSRRPGSLGKSGPSHFPGRTLHSPPMHNALRSVLLAVVAASIVAVAAAPAAAAVQWYEHYQRGLELVAEERWDEALSEFVAAAEVEPRARRQVRTRGNDFIFNYDPHYQIARCQVELGRWVPAGGQLRLASRAGVTPREKIEPLRRRIEAALLGSGSGERPIVKPPVLSVTSEPTGARVLVDGQPVGTTPLGPLATTAGEHTLRVEAPGYVAVERTVTLQPGEPQRLEVVLPPLPPLHGPHPRRRPRRHLPPPRRWPLTVCWRAPPRRRQRRRSPRRPSPGSRPRWTPPARTRRASLSFSRALSSS